MKNYLIYRHFCFLVLLLCLLAFTGCSKDEIEPDYSKIGKAEDLLILTPEYQPGTYRNIDKLFNTRTIKRGNQVFELPASEHSLSDLNYTTGGKKKYSVDDFIERNNVSGLLIIKNDSIVLERYALGNTDSSKWTSFSVAKSVTSTLIGAAVSDGIIKNINDQVTDYLPQLKGSAYDGVTVKNLMEMSSGVKWNEDYVDGHSDLSDVFKCIINGEEGGILKIMKGLPRAAQPGLKFNYSTGETFVESEVLRSALGGESISDYLSRKIWANMGMESDAYWMLESPDGAEFGGACISMVLRDYGRFGLFILKNGVIDGQPVLAPDWIEEARKPVNGSPQCDYGNLYSKMNTSEYPYYYPLGYGYNWWAIPETAKWKWDKLDSRLWWSSDATSSPELMLPNLSDTFLAQGIYGQFIHINKKENMVVVVWSAWKETWTDPREHEVYCFINAATEALK